MSLINFFQWIGVIGIGLFYVLQNWRAFASRNPAGLSFVGFCVLAVGVSAYVLLGFYLNTPIFLAVNALALAFDISLLALMLFHSATLSSEECATGLVVLIVGISALFAFQTTYSPAAATSIFGWIGLAGTIAFYPIQNAKIFIKRDPTGLSLSAFVSLLVGVVGLTVFGILIGDKSVLFGNLFSAVGAVGILWGIIRWKK